MPRSPSNIGRMGTTLGVYIRPEIVIRARELARDMGLSHRAMFGKLIEEGVERLERETTPA